MKYRFDIGDPFFGDEGSGGGVCSPVFSFGGDTDTVVLSESLGGLKKSEDDW